MEVIEKEIRKLVDRYATDEVMRRSLDLDLHLLAVRVVQDFRKITQDDGASYTPEGIDYDKKRVA